MLSALGLAGLIVALPLVLCSFILDIQGKVKEERERQRNERIRAGLKGVRIR